MDMPAWMPVILYSTALMVFLGIYAWRNMDDGIGRRPFVTLVALTVLMLITDLISRCYIYPGFPHLLVAACTYITFLMLPAIGAEWYQYVRSVLSAEERSRMRALDLVVNVVASIGIIVLMSSPITRWVFSFDASGVYHRGDLFIVPAVTSFLVMLMAEGFLMSRVRSLDKHAVTTLLMFPIAPLCGSALSMVFGGIPWIPLGISISMVILFTNILTTGMSTDYLTGAFNRKRLEEMMAERASRAQAGTGYRFAAVMVDVDDFKRINDTLGHATGDVALADAARLLKKCVRAGDAVARFGGDEFFMLLDVSTQEELEQVVQRMREEEDRFNSEEHPYLLGLSKGYDFYDPDRFDSIGAFEEHLDNLMYTNKELRRARRTGSIPQQNRRGVI